MFRSSKSVRGLAGLAAPLAGMAALAVMATTPALAADMPAPDASQGDGGVSAFYDWTGPIPAQAGLLLRSEPLPADRGLPGAARQMRILYTATDGVTGDGHIVVSGALFVPRGRAPAGGWPLLAWAHGTVGVADACAPSWAGRSKRDVDYLGRWLKEGFAIVATDYQGLGVAGPHPYLATRPEAYSTLDSIRAVQSGEAELGVDLGEPVVLIGQSQGGGAAFATAAFAPDYAPDIDIRGTVSTGIPFLTPQLMTAVATANPDKVDPTIAYLLYIGLLAEQAPTKVPASSMFTAKAAPVLDQARTACVVPVFNAVTEAGLTRANTMTPRALEVIQGLAPSLAYPTVKLAHPLFVGTGANDHDVPPPMQKAVVDAACAAGTVVEAHVYPGLDHSGAVNGSLGDSVPFVRKVMAGRPVTSTCGQPAS